MSLELSPSAMNLLTSQTEPDVAGVCLLASVYQRKSGVKSIRVISLCQGSTEEFSHVLPTMLHGLTMVITQEPDHVPISFSAVGNLIIFEDDIKQTGNLNRAFLDIDVFQQAGLSPVGGIYYISAAFGQYLSDVQKVELKY